MKKMILGLMVLFSAIILISCERPLKEEEKKAAGYNANGINDTEIVVGNTAATTGAFSVIGLPFLSGLQAGFEEYNNDTNNVRKIRFVHYNDEFNGDLGLTNTKKLVEEDKIFALVGHFGTNTIEKTMDYLIGKKVPMVYAATGTNALYHDSDAKNILSVQPIYRTEARMMVARALKENLFGPNGNAKISANAKIGVLYSDDASGTSMKVGLDQEFKTQGIAADRIKEVKFNLAEAATAVNQVLEANPEVIILAANQQPSTAAATKLREKGSTIPVITSYVNGATTFTPAIEQDKKSLPFEVYANTWLDIVDKTKPAPTADMVGRNGVLEGLANVEALSQFPGFTDEYWHFVKTMNTSVKTTTAPNNWSSPHAMAGYIAARTFIALLKKVTDFKALTWDSFLDLAEKEPIKLPLSGTLNFKDGKRHGITTLSLAKMVFDPIPTFEVVRPIESIEDVLKKN